MRDGLARQSLDQPCENRRRRCWRVQRNDAEQLSAGTASCNGPHLAALIYQIPLSAFAALTGEFVIRCVCCMLVTATDHDQFLPRKNPTTELGKMTWPRASGHPDFFSLPARKTTRQIRQGSAKHFGRVSRRGAGGRDGKKNAAQMSFPRPFREVNGRGSNSNLFLPIAYGWLPHGVPGRPGGAKRRIADARSRAPAWERVASILARRGHFSP